MPATGEVPDDQPERKADAWSMPAHLEAYRDLIGETGGNSVDELMREWTAGADGVMFANLPKYLIMVAVAAQVALLERLQAADRIGTVRPYVVVLFGSRADTWCELSHCPLGTVAGPFTREEATAYCATVPEGMMPHTLTLGV